LQHVLPVGGTLARCLGPTDAGRFVEAGESLATVASGGWQIHVMLSEEEVAACEPLVGDVVEFRPAAARTIAHASLTREGGGGIIVEAETHEAVQPCYEITVVLNLEQANKLRHGMTGMMRLPAWPEPIALHILRRFLHVTNSLNRS
jgi:hypothetical protein